MKSRQRWIRSGWLGCMALVCMALPMSCGGSGGGGGVDDAKSVDTNTPPSASIDSPNDGQTVISSQSVDFVGKVYDGEDTSEGLTVQWSSDWQGVLGTGNPNPLGVVTLTLDSLAVGTHLITLTVTDSKEASGSASIQLNVVADEVALALSIEPANPTASDNLTASIVAGEDPDVAYVFHWSKDGVASGLEGPTVTGDSTAKGELWTVTVSGVETAATGTASVTILNTVPTCTQVTLLPQAGPSNEPRECTCTQWDDVDSIDTPHDTCLFRDTQDAVLANAPTVGEGDSCTLDASAIVKGMQVVCTLTPHDGEAPGEPVDSGTSSVMNSPPSEPSNVVIGSLDPVPTVHSTLTCSYDETATDSDGDPLVYLVSWVVEGVEYPGTSETIVLADVDLSACANCVEAGPGSGVQCRVRACENIGGEVCSAPVDSDVLSLENLPPTGGSALVAVDPAGPATEASTLTCVASGAVDPEGSAITWDITWEIKTGGASGFSLIEGANTATLTGIHFDKGDTIRCVARPKDAQGAVGAPVTSKSPYPVVINTLPSLNEVSLYPQNPTRQDTLSCAFEWGDPDQADPVYVEVAWVTKGEGKPEAIVLNALVEQGTSTTMAASMFVPGDQVWCELTPKNGLDSGEMVTSNVVTVINQVPTAPTVALTLPDVLPGTGAFDGNAHCQVVTASIDPDGDVVSVSFQMSVNGVETANQNGIIAASLLSHCDLVTCVAIADDGWPDGATSSEPQSGQLAVGSDCPVAAFCELPTCVDGGGCGPSYYDETACDDGLFCNGGETCDLLVGCVLGLPPHEDNDPCTVDSCYEASEGVPASENCIASTEGTLCNAPDFVSQAPCDDGDPCTPIDLCEAGECLPQSENICIEERLSVFNDSARTAAIESLGYGRYVTHWKSDWDAASVFRVTDGNDSRLNEERVLDGVYDHDALDVGLLPLPGGRFVTADVRYEATSATSYNAVLVLSKYTLNGVLEAESSKVIATGVKVPNTQTKRAMRLRLMQFSGGGMGVVHGGWSSGDNGQNVYASVEPGDLSVGDWLPLMQPVMSWQSVKFDAQAVTTQNAAGDLISDGFRVAWVGYLSTLSPSMIWLDTYDATGLAASDWPSAALNIDGNCTSSDNQCVKQGALKVDYDSLAVTLVRLAILSNGDNVVVWERSGVIQGRVIGSDGSYLSDVFSMLPTGQGDGDQSLGDVAVFSDDHIIVVYGDSSEPSKEGQIRTWIFDPFNPQPPSSVNTLNVKGIGDQVSPDVTVFPGKSGTGADDEFVVSFVSDGVVHTRRLNRDGTPSMGIPERRGNVAYAGTQFGATAASARPALGQPNNVMVVYNSQESSTSKSLVYGRLFSHDGAQKLPEHALTNVVFHATEPQVAGSGDRFALVYTRMFNPGDDGDIKARFYNGKGVEVSDPSLPISVHSGVTKDQHGPSIAMALDTALIAWTSNHAENNDTVYGRVFDGDGEALSEPFSINVNDTKKQWQVSVSGHPDENRYALSWTTNKKGTKDVALRLFDVEAGGQVSTITDEVSVYDGVGQQEHSSVALASDGQVIVCFEWTGLGVEDDGDVACKRYVWVEGMLLPTNNGEPFYPFGDTVAKQQSPRIAFLNQSDFVVGWETENVDHSEHAIQMSHYTAASTLGAKGPRVVLNRTWTGNQSRPFVVNASAGTYWVGWDSTPPDGTVTTAGTDVYFRVFPKN